MTKDNIIQYLLIALLSVWVLGAVASTILAFKNTNPCHKHISDITPLEFKACIMQGEVK